MTELLDLCYDVLIRILEEIDPEDIAACAQTSRGFNEFIKKNKRLYKAQYLKNFDDPRRTPEGPEPQWVAELQKLVRCMKTLHSANNDLKRDEFRFVASTVESLITSGCTDASGESLNRHFVSQLFRCIQQNHDAFMCRSSLFGRVGKLNQKAANNKEDRQLSAKLHCLFGIPSTNAGRRVLSTHPHARSRVYDLRNYTEETAWGPFRDDGSMKVDWEMVESLMIVLGYNSGLCCRRVLHSFRIPWLEPLQGVIPERAQLTQNSSQLLLMEPDIPLSMKDPYNVTGVWSRIVCFLDYNDLYNFNFSTDALKVPSDELRETLNTEEAIRHIIMDFQVTEITNVKVRDDPEASGNMGVGGDGSVRNGMAPPDVSGIGPHDNPALPIVHFSGTSRSIDAAWDPNANSKIRGSVRLTPEGEVRWQTISVFYGGEERWRSEGVQVGGLRSQRGVIGTWFDKDYNAHGPVGPTAFWKISDQNLGDSDDSSGEDDNDVADDLETEDEDEDGGDWHFST